MRKLKLKKIPLYKVLGFYKDDIDPRLERAVRDVLKYGGLTKPKITKQ